MENIAQETEAGQVVPEVNSVLEQNGLGLSQPADSTETTCIPQGVTERSPTQGADRK